MIILELFLSFFKIGFFSFGGGYAMISLLQSEAIENAWLTASEFSDIVAISQMTPGPIAVNMATFVGFRQAGVLGSLTATLGVSLPSLIIIITAIKFIEKFKTSKTLGYIFDGLRPAVCGLIFAAAIQIAASQFFTSGVVSLETIDIKSIILCAFAFVAAFWFKRGPITILAASAIVGIMLF